MKYLTRLKSEKGLPDELPKLPKDQTQALGEPPKPPEAPFGSFGSIEGRHFYENVPLMPLPFFGQDEDLVIPFESDSRYHWWAGGQSITETTRELKGAINA